MMTTLLALIFLGTSNMMAAQAKVGILPFVDATTSGHRSLGADIARTLQAEMVHSTSLTPGVLLAGVLTAYGGAASAQTNPQCHLFTPAELAKFVGEPLASGHVAAMGTGCQWEGRSEEGYAIIQVVPARYHEPHKAAPGFKNLPTSGPRDSSKKAWADGTPARSRGRSRSSCWCVAQRRVKRTRSRC